MLRRCLGLATAFLPLSCQAETGAPITRIIGINSLTRMEAAEGRPVVVRGVITCLLPEAWVFTLSDDQNAVYVSPDFSKSAKLPPIQWIDLEKPAVGMSVEVHGITAPGGFSPCILAEKVVFLGTAPLPAAPTVTLTELRAGSFNCRRVTLSGVVQRMQRDPVAAGQMRLELATQEGEFSAFIADSGALNTSNLVDAEVRFIGTIFTFFNTRGEASSPFLRVASMADLTTMKPAHADPFDAPQAQALTLRPFSVELPNLHRQRLTGVVTLARPGRFLYLRGEVHCFRVNTHSMEPFMPGDIVEAAGFVATTESFAALSESVIRKIGTAPLPPPLSVTRSQLLTWKSPPMHVLHFEDYEGQEIVLQGKLVKIETMVEQDTKIFIDFEGALVAGILGQGVSAAALGHLHQNSEVELRGVCVMRLESKWPAFTQPQPTSFSLLLQSPASVRVLRPPPWWTPARLQAGLAILLGTVLLVGAWAVTLRRIVARQTAVIAEKAGREVLYEERNRMARELHDTLEQNLTGVRMQIETAGDDLDESPAEARHSLNAAVGMLAFSHEEARRSVWNLRNPLLLEGGLVGAIQTLIPTHSHEPKISVHTTGKAYRLPAAKEFHLFRIAQEAVTNALKHAHPRNISITLNFLADSFVLMIDDDGRGFKTSAQGTSSASGIANFGLLGMRERTIKINATFTIESNPDKGTQVVVRVPTQAAERILL